VDLRATLAAAAPRQDWTSWADVVQVLVDHQPVPCMLRLLYSACGDRWPCLARELALDELTGQVLLT
jgi:hypothetical protein